MNVGRQIVRGARPVRADDFLAALLTVLFVAPVAHAQTPPADLCGISEQYAPVISPKIFPGPISPQSDQALECVMWQSFIYLNWPAQEIAPGSPDATKPFGSTAPTVWQTFKTHDQVFLPGGAAPGPWRNRTVPQTFASSPLADSIVKSQTRALRQATKISPDLASSGQHALDQINQAFGGQLFDQNGQPVYYEMLVNQDLYNYIVRYRLYAADSQLRHALQNGIKLPSGRSEDGETGTIEIKAAWKIMSAAELAQRPLRFHTMPAVLNGHHEVTVGLVGMHIHQRIAAFPQGVWATFGQIDNSPLASDQNHSRRYSFFNAECDRCQPNTPTPMGTPTQVVRNFANNSTAERINAYVRDLIDSYGRNLGNPSIPWRYYELLGVQWPKHPEEVGSAGQAAPLPLGDPNRDTLMNPVLETFMQRDGINCIDCHSRANLRRPAPNGSPLGAGYSFLLGHAE